VGCFYFLHSTFYVHTHRWFSVPSLLFLCFCLVYVRIFHLPFSLTLTLRLSPFSTDTYGGLRYYDIYIYTDIFWIKINTYIVEFFNSIVWYFCFLHFAFFYIARTQTHRWFSVPSLPASKRAIFLSHVVQESLQRERKTIVHILKNKKGRDREDVTSETLLRDKTAIEHILQKQNIHITRRSHF